MAATTHAPTPRTTKAALIDESTTALRRLLTPGATVYVINRHTSASGMTRRLSFFTVSENRMAPITWHISHALGYLIADTNGHRTITVQGCGMDMGFHVVSSLGATLWPNGTPMPHGRRNGEPDSDGGYALKSEWL